MGGIIGDMGRALRGFLYFPYSTLGSGIFFRCVARLSLAQNQLKTRFTRFQFYSNSYLIHATHEHSYRHTCVTVCVWVCVCV